MCVQMALKTGASCCQRVPQWSPLPELLLCAGSEHWLISSAGEAATGQLGAGQGLGDTGLMWKGLCIGDSAPGLGIGPGPCLGVSSLLGMRH